MVKLQISGVLLASILSDFSNSPSDLEGFMFGACNIIRTSSLQDESHMKETAETVIVIQKFVKLKSAFSFYNRVGEINENELNKQLSETKLKFLGWFRFRRNITLKPTCRDELIQDNLEKYFQQKFYSESILFGLFTTNAEQNLSTHSSDFCFLRRLENKSSQKLHLQILNIVETTEVHYKKFVSVLPETSEGEIGILRNSLRKIQTDETIAQYEDICEKYLESLGKATEDLARSENDLEKLRREVEQLRNEEQRKQKDTKIDELQKEVILIDLSE